MCVFCRLGSKFVSIIGTREGYIKPIVAITAAVFPPSLKKHKSPHETNVFPSVSNKYKIKKIKSLKFADLDLFIK